MQRGAEAGGHESPWSLTPVGTGGAGQVDGGCPVGQETRLGSNAVTWVSQSVSPTLSLVLR